jgi:hypothetical protein
VTDERRAMRFFRTVLILATCASVAGNVTPCGVERFARRGDRGRFGSAGAATVLLGATHSVAVARVRTSAGFTYWATMTITMTLALCAFVLSFDALRSLAVDLAGFTPDIAWLWPLCIDLSITASTPGAAVVFATPRDYRTTASATLNKQPDGVSPAPPSCASGQRVNECAGSRQRYVPDTGR